MEYTYDRSAAVIYAMRWAYRRNPLFFDFTDIGGNCTNFVSQCILAGCCTMNFTNTYGWYYVSPEDRSPSWTGVEYLYNFLTSNVDAGPYGEEADVLALTLGDVVQLASSDGDFYHSLLVVGTDMGEPLLAAQSNDAFARPLSAYSYATARGIHILGYRKDAVPCPCFKELYSGESLLDCL